MVISNAQNQRTLQLTLYSGVALIVISMLFLGREQQSASFVAQALTVLAAPAFFYIVGALVWRYLRTPLAAPGLIATGAWLVGVGLVHLYDKRILLPEAVQPYYWFGASLLASALITMTGHRVRIWMLVPLVPLVQVNTVWAVMGALGIDVIWMPPLSFLLVLVWWEAPIRDEHWVTVYRTGGILLTLFLLLFSLWLPIATAQSLMLTWGVGAVLVALLGLRHGWVRMGPLAITMLTCASISGLPLFLWPFAWLALAFGTVIFIEQITSREEKSKDAKAVEISQALALVLSGASALFAQVSYTFGAPVSPVIIALVLLGAGVLLVWLGWRRELRLAVHIGLWLMASAWASLYFIALPTSGMFGLWLALLAACALLVERLLSARRKEKYKGSNTILETVIRWPIADLVIGLSVAIILWMALHINAASPLVLAVTCSLVVSIWLVGGLSYRLPVLLHTALWIAPLPYALLLLLVNPAIWTLPLMGLAWQILGVIFLLLGHSLVRYRPAILAPFFIVGYVLLGFGLTLAMANETLLPVSLGLVVLASIGTSVAVIANYHPAWSMFVAWLLPAHKFPYAYRNFNHLFLFLAAWLSAIWLHLMLGYSGMPLARQGVFLVIFAGAWFLLGRMLSHLPGVVGWPVSGAGWLMWLIGLLEVFFSPVEAIITMILGLVLSGEALRRSREIHWIPVFIVQVFFTVLQVAWMLALPGRVVLLLVAVAISITGMVYERRSPRAGRMTALTGTVLAAGLWLLNRDIYPLLGLNVLAIIAVLRYWRWQWLWTVYAGIALLVIESRAVLDWRGLVVVGLVQCVVGAELVKALRPRKYRALWQVLFEERDWATPYLWVGAVVMAVGWGVVFLNTNLSPDILVLAFLAALMAIIYTIRLRIRQLPYISLALVGVGLIFAALWITVQPFAVIGNLLIGFSASLAALALVIRWSSISLLVEPRLRANARWMAWWIRPLLAAAYVLSGTSVGMLFLLGSFYPVDLGLRISNSLLLAVFAALVYAHRPHLAWLGASLFLLWHSWVLAANTMQLNSLLWHTIPTGVILLVLARVLRHPAYTVLECIGTVLLLLGSAAGLDWRNPMSSQSLMLVVHLFGLLVYGYLAGRRIPFASAVMIAGGGLVLVVARINIWLIPLGCGLLLLTVTIVTEAQGSLVERWMKGWVARWQHWR